MMLGRAVTREEGRSVSRHEFFREFCFDFGDGGREVGTRPVTLRREEYTR